MLINAVLWLPDEGLCHFTIRLHHFSFHRLRRQWFAIGIAQQRINDHRFARAIEIARAKNEELFVVALRAINREFGQIQRRAIKVDERSLAFTGRQQQLAFGVSR